MSNNNPNQERRMQQQTFNRGGRMRGQFSGVKEINAKGVLSVVLACKYIMSFYRTRFFVTKNNIGVFL